MEVYYLKLGEPSQDTFEMNQRLGWKDEVNHLYYEIYDNTSSTLSKEDLVKLAEDVLQGKSKK